MTDYKPFIFKLEQSDNKILDKPIDKKRDVIISPIINYPSLSLGYHYFIHRTKESMERTNQLESKNKFYYIVNPFEHTISNHDEDLTNDTKKFFKMKDNEGTPENSRVNWVKITGNVKDNEGTIKKVDCILINKLTGQ